MYNIKFLKYNNSEFAEVKAIRTAVFTNEQGADAECEFDSDDRSADFLLLYDNGKAVATSRVIKNEKGYKIGRIAVLKKYRGKGYGAVIVRAVTEKAFENGADKVYVDAQNYAVPFYEKLGFTAIGEELIDRGILHTPMIIEKESYYGR